MSKKQHKIIQDVYNATSDEQSAQAYDQWAHQYEQDVLSWGARFPFVAATVFARFVGLEQGKILDAGCGTGLQGELLHLCGYSDIVGIDMSEGMLSVARPKGIYSSLYPMTLGQELDFADDTFANAITTGTITPGHAPPHSFMEIIRVTRSQGKIIVNIRTDDDVDPAYPAALREYENSGLWKKIYQSEEYPAMPTGEPDILTTAYVYEVL
ncbi:MAG: methyltransferase domain-containing protein [Gammaproteobacteria bacterium]|nr:methyltransferase domain-containing protein [Gammaproteobacteria bacterium]